MSIISNWSDEVMEVKETGYENEWDNISEETKGVVEETSSEVDKWGTTNIEKKDKRVDLKSKQSYFDGQDYIIRLMTILLKKNRDIKLCEVLAGISNSKDLIQAYPEIVAEEKNERGAKKSGFRGRNGRGRGRKF
jgi:hypothetical protein